MDAQGNEQARQDDGDKQSANNDAQLQAPSEGTPPQSESEQATAQWLRRIPDDPGGLWRRKFQYQYKREYQSQQGEAKPW
jgi:Ca-activated chloride channel family protein